MDEKKYYKYLKELTSDDKLFTFTIQGHGVSKEKFYKHLQKIHEEKKTHADTIRNMALK